MIAVPKIQCQWNIGLFADCEWKLTVNPQRMTQPCLGPLQGLTDAINAIHLLWNENNNLRQEVARLKKQEKKLIRVEGIVDDLRTSFKENATAIRDLTEKVGGVTATASMLADVFFSFASRTAGKGHQPNDARAGASAGLDRSREQGHRQCV